ncbi:MAG: hypothetical protein U0132_09330 [Gemmatimonadaceae bacterium]
MTQPPLSTHTASTPTKQTALAGELAELVLELALSLHKRAIYPASHPLLRGAVDSLWGRVKRAVEGRGVVSMGVARHQLIVEGVATDEAHPLIRELATHLHEHQIAALRFHQGVERDEIDDLLGTLAVAAARVDRPLGSLHPEMLSRWRHIALFPASFEQLELVDDGADELAAHDDSPEAQQLWLGLARAALAGHGDVSEEDADAYDPTRVARAIDSRRGERAYEQVVIGYFLQVTAELDKLPKGTKTAERLRSRVSSLLSSLNPDTLARLMEMGGNQSQRGQFLKQATDHLSASAVLDLVRASASVSSRTISDAMMRLLTKLARNASGARSEATNADRLLRSQVRHMLEGWTLEDPNPDGYSELLRGIGHSENRTEVDRERDACEPERIVELSSEVGVIGPATETAIARWVARDGMAAVLDRLTVLPSGEIRERLIDSLVNGALLGEQLQAERPDVRVLEHAVLRLRERATEPLLDAMARRDERDANWIADLLGRTGSGGLAIVLQTLMKRTPFVQRVLLGVLDRADETPADADLDELTRSEDVALRREALRLMMKQARTRETAMLRALRDRDEKTVSLALAQALRQSSPAVAAAIMTRIDNGADLSPDMRSRAVRAVAASGSDTVVRWLRDLAITQHWLLRYSKLRKPSPESVAAVAGLAAHWAEHVDASLALVLAKRSSDAAYRHAVRRGEER